MEPEVWLRELQIADIPTYVDWVSDRRLCEHAGWGHDAPRSAHEAKWHEIVGDRELTRLAALQGDELIGFVDLAGTDPDHRELGYVIGPSARWGQGLGTRVAQLGVDHGFTVLNLTYINAEAPETNEASVRILVSLGMTETDQQGSHPYLGVATPTRCFRISRESYLRQNPVPEGK
ncbi:N-acetyltransferase [Kribbella antibiotica]|uniref:N-acetyltransferase n=1 Tax=Kribbella antibiotica TaxID=190195 RepID=A0A4V6PE54_9ACTN|nr:GNAT family N-acetyltransferase [Kribbella antibiotica]TDD57407.1 N-acetyltransferase [Kribbella antibiotica]